MNRAEAAATPETAKLAQALASPLARLSDAVDWVVKTHRAAPAQTAASAVSLMHLAGYVVGGWLVLKQAQAAARLLDSGENDPAFLRGKLAFADFYASQLLPRAEALHAVIVNGAEDIASFDPALLAG